jgi:hypothetical protein
VLTPSVAMSETGIAWSTDKNKFKQIPAATRAQYNTSILFIEDIFPQLAQSGGPENEHFIVWMRTAGLPDFRKYYGKIDTDISAGDSITFNITTNFEVQSYGGSKALVLTNLANFGAKNYALGNSYIVIGSYALVLGLMFMFKRVYAPRKLGDIRSLKWD